MTTTTKDPVCGKDVDPLRARAVGIFGGVTYYFCSAECKGKFQDPRKTPRAPAPPEPKPAKPGVEPAPKPAPKKVERDVELAPPMRPARADEPSDPVPVKRDPTPSVQADVQAARSGTRSWMLVFLLFTVAGVVLYFALWK